jgi:hypothetical protein
MRRREFITLAGGAVTAWPLAAHAQQSKMPTIGFLSGRSLASDFHLAAAFRQGLKEIGHVEGQNLTIEFSRIPTGNICPARRTPGRRPIPISPKSANGRTAPTSSSSRTCNGPTTTRIPIATRIRNPAATQATRSTSFKVEPAQGSPHPEDRWYAWIKDEWKPVPPDKIVPDYAPDGQAYLFMLSDMIVCFVRPKGGL